MVDWEEKTGKSSPYNDSYIIIRISDHDLSPTYDGIHGYYDFDLKSKFDKRHGTIGNAEFYFDFLEYVSTLVEPKKQTRNKLNADYDFITNKNIKKLYDNRDIIDNIDAKVFLCTLFRTKLNDRINLINKALNSESKDDLEYTISILDYLQKLSDSI